MQRYQGDRLAIAVEIEDEVGAILFVAALQRYQETLLPPRRKWWGRGAYPCCRKWLALALSASLPSRLGSLRLGVASPGSRDTNKRRETGSSLTKYNLSPSPTHSWRAVTLA